MKRPMMLALAVAVAAPDAAAAQPAIEGVRSAPGAPQPRPGGVGLPSMAMDCGAEPAAAAAEAPNLHGIWDFLMDVGGTPSFGLMAIGRIDGGYGGSLTPSRTAPVVLRRITLTGARVHLVVASSEGDVLFDGRLSAAGDRMCGTVTYHGGRTFAMMAQKRPSDYLSQPRRER